MTSTSRAPTAAKPFKKPRKGHVLVMRTCTASLTSHKGFVWPESGDVEAPDWDPVASCGNGLHGLKWGVGDGSLLDWSEPARWLVVEVAEADLVDLGGKVKFPRGRVVHVGDRQTAAELISTHAPEGSAVTAGTATAGDRGTATAGYSGTATAGDRGTATAGYSGTATAGDWGTATAGDRGTATAGYKGTATAGEDGALVIHHYHATRCRYTVKVAEVDGKKIKPNVAYRLNEAGEFVEAGS